MLRLLQYCVSGNSLAAITYWCQGKSSCKFNPQWLLESTEGQKRPALLYYVHDYGSPVQDYLVATQSCAQFGTLAQLKSQQEAFKALDIIGRVTR